MKMITSEPVVLQDADLDHVTGGNRGDTVIVGGNIVVPNNNNNQQPNNNSQTNLGAILQYV